MIANIESIKKEVVVSASQEMAFNVFTKKMYTWWPKTHHIGTCPMTGLIVEPRSGGRWYSIHEDGTEVMNGHVLTWDPYGLLLLNWQINANFKCAPELNTEVEILFIPEGPNQTRVILEHKNLDRLDNMEVIGNMDKGWEVIMELYKTAHFFTAYEFK
jgi:uncharacterized protein YndB with AHSA1/START domain